MKKRWIGFAALACVACCAAPLLLVGGGVAALAAISVDQWVCGGLLVAMTLGVSFLLRKRAQKNCATTGANSCSTGCGCQAGAKGE